MKTPDNPNATNEITYSPAPPFSNFEEMDEFDYFRMKLARTIIWSGDENDKKQMEDSRMEGLEIQNRFKNWILNAIFQYYEVKIQNLVFDKNSPWLAPDKDIIFFRVQDSKSNAFFIVSCDLNNAGDIIDYRVSIEK